MADLSFLKKLSLDEVFALMKTKPSDIYGFIQENYDEFKQQLKKIKVSRKGITIPDLVNNATRIEDFRFLFEFIRPKTHERKFIQAISSINYSTLSEKAVANLIECCRNDNSVLSSDKYYKLCKKNNPGQKVGMHMCQYALKYISINIDYNLHPLTLAMVNNVSNEMTRELADSWHERHDHYDVWFHLNTYSDPEENINNITPETYIYMINKITGGKKESVSITELENVNTNEVSDFQKDMIISLVNNDLLDKKSVNDVITYMPYLIGHEGRIKLREDLVPLFAVLSV